MPKKKKYNPFEMWGSYVGAIIAILMPPIIKVSFDITNVYLIHLTLMLSIAISAFFGFLLGWGIHSLIRKLRK